MKVIIACLLAVLMFGGIALAAPNHHSDNNRNKLSKNESVKCPVTGDKIDPAKAFSKTTYKGKTYYFCCAVCQKSFKKNPEKYKTK